MARTEIDRLNAVARLAALAGPGRLAELEAYIPLVVPRPLPELVAYELLLQCYLFFGYPQAIEALRVFTSVASLPEPELGPADDFPFPEFRRRGSELCRRIYYPNYEQLINNMRRISPELSEWMIVEGYGKVLSRPGPEPLEREIASIVFLCCSGHPVQLFSHVRGARNLGAGQSQLRAAVLAAQLTETETRLAVETIDRVFYK
jgi:alkylhydroperoxidase/carboxymuconolactone decarboxylase family protein YurZ